MMCCDDGWSRISHINNSKIKETAYTSLVRPTVEYASSVWDPYHQNNKHRLEMVQRREARYVTNRHHNTSYVSSMIEDLNWKSLEVYSEDKNILKWFRIDPEGGP
jgi:hypothetical protein